MFQQKADFVHWIFAFMVWKAAWTMPGFNFGVLVSLDGPVGQPETGLLKDYDDCNPTLLPLEGQEPASLWQPGDLLIHLDDFG
ncbi:hypothetical protein MA16_Dca028701 [Dendrobium catenatum]|uniref:Uncharacterized protein n=1 Tax=Dendrobium catenatum TaxID=906689 RepID=A0A2I0V8E1_9ASPA|nr:hypothetical protein MA16_Dca028701 [Dendrobium catenatum]